VDRFAYPAVMESGSSAPPRWGQVGWLALRCPPESRTIATTKTGRIRHPTC